MRAIGVYIAIAAGAFVLNAAWKAGRDETGAIVSEGSIDAFDMRVGDCFNDSAPLIGEGEEEIQSVPGVPCSEPHDNEVFAVFDVDVARFPEADDMAELAFESCLERFEGFVGTDYMSSSLDIVTMYPSRDSWRERNDREVICSVYDMNAEKLVGSVAGMAL